MDELNRLLVRFFGIFIYLAASFIPAWAGMEPQPLPNYADADSLRDDSSLTAVAFADPRSEAIGIGIAVGDRGVLLRSTDRGQTWNEIPSPVDCRLQDVIWIGSRSVVVVGGGYDTITQLSRGVVLVSRDAGASFRKIADHDLPLLRNLHLSENRSLVAEGDWSHSQLSDTFVSRDGGRTWQGTQHHGNQPDSHHTTVLMQPTNLQQPTADGSPIQSATSFVRWQRITGSSAPLRDSCRITADRLCVVGDHGLISTSEDNGETWSTRRGVDRHVAILLIASDAQSASWSLLGAESLQWRYRCSLLIEDAPVDAAASRKRQNLKDLGLRDPGLKQLGLIRQAAVTLGAASADWFRGSGEFNESSDLQARRWIAVHRPAVVVIDESVSKPTRQAILQAAASMGVSRVLLASKRDHGGSLLHHNALLPRIGLLSADLTLDAQQIVAPQRCEPSSLSLTRLYDSGSSRIGGGGESIMAGLTTSKANQLSGIAKSISRHRLQVVQARMKQSQLIGQLVNPKINSSTDFQRSLKQLLNQTSAEDQLRMAWSILDQTGGTRLEDLCLAEIAERFSNRSFGGWAAVRLHAHQTSAEHGMLKSMGMAMVDVPSTAPVQAASVALSPFQISRPNPLRSASEIASQQDAFHQNPVQQASTYIPVGVGGPEVVQATAISQQPTPTASVDLQLDLHPAVMLSRFDANQDVETISTDPTVTTQGDIDRIASQGTTDWKQLLGSSSNYNLANYNDSRQLHVKRTDSPPRLDGKLDDACWQSDEPAMIQGSLQLRFASDQKYVYVAAICPSHDLAIDTHQRSLGSNSRDQSLLDVDHLRLRFDTDGDLWTSFAIEVTDAGRTRDTVDGNTIWQPTWYVDVARDDQFVTFEIAIRKSDLMGSIGDDKDKLVNDRWFVSVEAVLAGQKLTEPILPQPSHWRAVNFEQPEKTGRQQHRPNQLRSNKLKPAGPVRLAPVELLP